MYQEVKSQVKVQNVLSETFEVEIGTRQGCNRSPSLFNIFLNDLPS